MTSIKIKDAPPERSSKSPDASLTLDGGDGPSSRDRADSTGSGKSAGASTLAGNNRRTIESAKKKILWLASKSEWNSLEQLMKTLELAVAGSKDPADQSPLANVRDEVKTN